MITRKLTVTITKMISITRITLGTRSNQYIISSLRVRCDRIRIRYTYFIFPDIVGHTYGMTKINYVQTLLTSYNQSSKNQQ